MRTVRDEEGDRYLLVKEADDASLVRDPATGEECYVDNDRLSVVEGASPLALAARAVPAAVRRLLTAVPDEQALGLLVALDDRGPLGGRELLGAADRCESDLHGLLAELRAAGLVEEREVAGERGYALSATGERALDRLRD